MPDADSRISINLRVDADKFAMLENLRTTGFGISRTERNRSDVYNEVLGYGLQVQMIKSELGDKDFQKFWEVVHKMNLKHLNFEAIQKFVGK